MGLYAAVLGDVFLARGQLNRKLNINISIFPRSRLRIWPREMSSALAVWSLLVEALYISVLGSLPPEIGHILGIWAV